MEHFALVYPCKLTEGTKAFEAYEDEVVYERHRHRYEFNNQYRQAMEEAGFVFSGTSPDGRLVEIIELKDHPWFVASQFHPEFISRPNRPQPLFRDFVRHVIKAKRTIRKAEGITSNNIRKRMKPRFQCGFCYVIVSLINFIDQWNHAKKRKNPCEVINS